MKRETHTMRETIRRSPDGAGSKLPEPENLVASLYNETQQARIEELKGESGPIGKVADMLSHALREDLDRKDFDTLVENFSKAWEVLHYIHNHVCTFGTRAASEDRLDSVTGLAEETDEVLEEAITPMLGLFRDPSSALRRFAEAVFEATPSNTKDLEQRATDLNNSAANLAAKFLTAAREGGSPLLGDIDQVEIDEQMDGIEQSTLKWFKHELLFQTEVLRLSTGSGAPDPADLAPERFISTYEGGDTRARALTHKEDLDQASDNEIDELLTPYLQAVAQQLVKAPSLLEEEVSPINHMKILEYAEGRGKAR